MVTFTGVDVHTNLDELKNVAILGLNYLTEWGILLSTSENKMFDDSRYSSLEDIKRIASSLQEYKNKGILNLSLHVCGKESKLLLEQSEQSKALDFMDLFNRVQINTVFDNESIKKYEVLSQKYNNTHFITQNNRKNQKFLKQINDWAHPNTHVLVDSSGGRGILGEWEKINFNGLVGYAGGLGPDNIVQEYEKINDVADKIYWIDMEGKIRTNGNLDLSKIKQVVENLNTAIDSHNKVLNSKQNKI